MKFYFTIITVAMLMLSCHAATRDNSTPQDSVPEPSDTSKNAVTVLELFTSQGCSSCPSADKLLEKYSKEKNIIVLAFHVDYWNRLGWKDPYSSPLFTKRQYAYASSLHASVYTPQLVVNGQAEMVGSDSRRIDQAIKKFKPEDKVGSVSIDSVSYKSNTAVISYTVNGEAADSKINLAIIEKETKTPIRNGENAGLTLSGRNVVINFKTINTPQQGVGSVTMDIPEGIAKNKIAIVMYLQQPDNSITSAIEHAL
ncbi:MAG: DUF1223 domain-containing protein [Ginsengibacter sp.]